MTAILVPACWALCLGMFTSCNQIKIFKFLKLRGGRKLTARCSPWKGILLVSEIVCCSSHRATRVVPRYFNIRGLKCIDHFRTWPLTEQFQSSANGMAVFAHAEKWMGNAPPNRMFIALVGFFRRASHANVGKGKPERPKVPRFMRKNGHCNIRQAAQDKRERYMSDLFTTFVDLDWMYR